MLGKEETNNFFKPEKIKTQWAHCIHIIDKNGIILKQSGSNQSLKMPMASTYKVAVGLAIGKLITEGTISLTDLYEVTEEDLVAGLPTSYFDGHYFNPDFTPLETTLEQLLDAMFRTSDNTAADRLIKIAGGITAINTIIDELGLKNYSFHSTNKELISNFYQIPSGKSPENILKALVVLSSAFETKPTEKAFFKEALDSASPEALVNLASIIVTSAQHDNQDGWLPQASRLILEKMNLCETNKTRIGKGIEMSNAYAHVTSIYGKSGALGSITRELAILELDNDTYAIMDIATCLCPLSPLERDDKIAQLTHTLLDETVQFQPTRDLVS